MPSFWTGFGQQFGETFGDTFRQARADRLRREERDEDRAYREKQDERQRERVAKAKRDRMIAAIGAATPEARERYTDTAQQPIPFTGTQREGVMQTALAQDTGVEAPHLWQQTPEWQAEQDAIRMDIAERQLGKAEADIGRETTSDKAFEDFKRRARATTEEGIARSLRILKEVNPEQFQQQLEQQMTEWEALSPHRQEAYNQSMSLFKDKALFNLDLAGKADDAGKAGMLGELLGRQGIRWGKDGKDVIRRLSEAGHDIENAAVVSAAQRSNAEGISLFEKSSYEEKKVALMELATAWPLLNAASATPRSFEFFREAYKDAGLTADIDANEDFLKAKFATGTVNRKLRDEGIERADEARIARELEGADDWLKRHGFGVGERLGRIFQKAPVEFRGVVSKENEMLKDMRRQGLLDEDYRPTNELKLHFRDNPNELMKWELYHKETGSIPSMTLPPAEMLKEIKTSVEKSQEHVFAAIDRFPDLDINTQGELARLLAEDTALSSAQVQSAEEKLAEFAREASYNAALAKTKDVKARQALWAGMVGEENKDKDYILVPEVIGGGLSDGIWVPPSIGVGVKLNPKYFHRNQMSEESQLRLQREVEDMEKSGSGLPQNLPISGETSGGNKFGDVRVEPDGSQPREEGVSPQPMKSSAAPPDYTGKVKPSDTRLVKRAAIGEYKAGLEKLRVRKDIIDRRVKALSDYLFER